ncbi:endonuclease/exonuclease/phosphatase family protein [Paenibacillus sp.]|uniref:endonuclease/exonuclease/phosphatase family protein n=1 Tax=Paenibacillus sp. TaxID=58172 RepID=UPI00281184D0|nr:endonuclease/exonuclease/phosphatase family protein [Paenibacillus sp.]
MSMIVMTYNLRIDVEADGNNAWPLRFQEAARSIAKASPDIVGTQELNASMLRDLEGLLPEYAWIGEGRLGGGEGEFNAIGYRRDRWTAEDSGTFGLSETPETLGAISWDSNCPRICTWARLRGTRGSERLVFNTHLDHMSEEARREGMRLIVERMTEARRIRPLPTLLTGDFNCEPDAPPHKGLTDAGFVDAYSVWPGEDGPGRTYHAFQGGKSGKPIDYIYVTPDLRIRSVALDRTMYEGRYPSDHYAVTVELEERE